MTNINVFKERIDWEGTSIEKLTCDKSIPVNERIFALCRAALLDDSLVVRLWSFDCFPKKEDSLSWTIYNDKGESMKAEAYLDGSCTLKIGEKEVKGELKAAEISGEDLQGEYRGSIFSIPAKLISSHLGWDILTEDRAVLMEMRKEGKFPSVFKGEFKISR